MDFIISIIHCYFIPYAKAAVIGKYALAGERGGMFDIPQVQIERVAAKMI